MKKIIIFLIFLCIGCGPAGIGAGIIVNGVVVWQQRTANKYYSFDNQTTYRAIKRSLQKLNITIKKDFSKKGKQSIVAGQKANFNIQIKPSETNISKVSITINLLGDKQLAELIFAQIDRELNIITFDNGKPVSMNK